MKKLAVVVGAVAACAAVAGVAFATIPSSSGVISACYAKNGGALRVIDDGVACAKGETKLTWNQQGQPGPTGATGATGAAGAAAAKYFLLYSKPDEGGTTSAVRQQSGGMTVAEHADQPFGPGWVRYEVTMPTGVNVSQCVAQAAFSALNDSYVGVQGQDPYATSISSAGTTVSVYGHVGPSGIPIDWALSVFC